MRGRCRGWVCDDCCKLGVVVAKPGGMVDCVVVVVFGGRWWFGGILTEVKIGPGSKMWLDWA